MNIDQREPPIDGAALLAMSATRAYQDDPYPFLAALRERAAVARVAGGPWLVTRYNDVSAVLRHPRLGNDPRGAPGGSAAVGGTSATQVPSPSPISALDPPEHGRVRRALSSVLPVSLVEDLRDRIADVTDEQLDRLLARRGATVDLIPELVSSVPVQVAAELFGLPADEQGRIAEWGNRLAAGGDPDLVLAAADRSAAATAEREIARYFAQLVVQRRRRPGHDLVSVLATGLRAANLDFAELVVNAAFLFVNSYHNTVSLIGNGVLALLRHPDELARLRADPRLAPAVVEEALRYDSPIQSIARVTREPVTVAGVTIPARQQVMVLIGAAHRDPDAFVEPDAFRLTGRDRRALSFGAGRHYCIGAGLARMQAETVIGRLVSRLPELTLAGQPERTTTFALRGISALPVRVE